MNYTHIFWIKEWRREISAVEQKNEEKSGGTRQSDGRDSRRTQSVVESMHIAHHLPPPYGPCPALPPPKPALIGPPPKLWPQFCPKSL